MDSTSGSRWKVADSQAHFLERAGKEPYKCIFFGNEQDLSSNTWAAVKRKFGPTAALETLTILSLEESTMGACSR